MKEPCDVELLKRIVDRDRAALAALFARHHARVLRFVHRIVASEAIAEELANEVFLDVWRHAERFSGRSTPATWILAIARNKAISHLRRRREEGLDERMAEAIADPDDPPETHAIKRDKGAVMRRCLDRLSPEHREVLDLVYYHERSVREVAEIVGIPEGTVKTRMFHARKKLAELLKAAGIDRGWP